MRIPKCCGGQLMDKWVSRKSDYSYHHWCCEKCEKVKDFYFWPWVWIWLVVGHNDLEDEILKPKWWLGSIGALHNFYQRETTFTIIPFNVLIDWAIRAWKWCRYRKPDKFNRSLEDSYRRGRVDGMSRQRALQRDYNIKAKAEIKELVISWEDEGLIAKGQFERLAAGTKINEVLINGK